SSSGIPIIPQVKKPEPSLFNQNTRSRKRTTRFSVMNFIEGINWYAIQTKSKQEDLVAYYLSQLGMEILNPKQMKEKFVWGRPKIVTEPLFPGYMFAKF